MRSFSKSPTTATPPQRKVMSSRSEPSSAALVLTLALSSGLCLGAADAIVDMSVRSSVSASPLSTWTCLGISALAGALAFVLLWLVSTPLRRRWASDAGASGLALAAVLLTLALPTLLTCYRAVDQDQYSTLLAIPAAVVVAIGVYLLARPFSSRSGGRAAVTLFAAWISTCAVCVAAFIALRKAEVLSGGAASAIGALALVVVIGASAWLLWHSTTIRTATLALCALFVGAAVMACLHVHPRIEAAAEKGRVPVGRKPRQVVLVIVDTLRADYLSCYSEHAPPTPTLDALAAKSLFFAHPRSSAPWTFPSVSSIQTGLAPSVHLGLRPFDALPDKVTTLAQRMSAAGFLTAAFVRNPALRQYTHIDRGFDEYHFQREPHPPSALAEVLLRPLLPETYLPQVGAEVQTRRVSEWISAHKDRDFFLWVHYFDPHMSYNPPREFQPEGTPPPEIGRNFEDAARVRGGFLNPDAAEREWIRKLYAGEVRATDRGIAGLFKSLESNGIFDNSLIVFTADHGDELWEHDGFEHGHVMYDEVLGVPLFMKLPAGALVQRVDEAVSNQSIAATVLEVAGVPYLQEEFSAPPLVRRSAGEATLSLAVHPRALVSSGILYFEARTAVVFEGFKYIQFHVSKREELYDLAADPGEKHNLLAERPEFADRGRALLRAELDKATAMRLHLGIDSAQSGQLDKDNARAMRALGYVK